MITSSIFLFSLFLFSWSDQLPRFNADLRCVDVEFGFGHALPWDSASLRRHILGQIFLLRRQQKTLRSREKRPLQRLGQPAETGSLHLFTVYFFSCGHATTYKRICPSVRLSVRWSDRRSVVIESKSVKMRIYDAALLQSWLSVFVNEHGVGEGMDGGWMPLPTRSQRYCDPASLVFDGVLKICCLFCFLLSYVLIDGETVIVNKNAGSRIQNQKSLW